MALATRKYVFFQFFIFCFHITCVMVLFFEGIFVGSFNEIIF
jgi:hypothetical protein